MAKIYNDTSSKISGILTSILTALDVDGHSCMVMTLDVMLAQVITNCDNWSLINVAVHFLFFYLCWPIDIGHSE